MGFQEERNKVVETKVAIAMSDGGFRDLKSELLCLKENCKKREIEIANAVKARELDELKLARMENLLVSLEDSVTFMRQRMEVKYKQTINLITPLVTGHSGKVAKEDNSERVSDSNHSQIVDEKEFVKNEGDVYPDISACKEEIEIETHAGGTEDGVNESDLDENLKVYTNLEEKTRTEDVLVGVPMAPTLEDITCEALVTMNKLKDDETLTQEAEWDSDGQISQCSSKPESPRKLDLCRIDEDRQHFEFEEMEDNKSDWEANTDVVEINEKQFLKKGDVCFETVESPVTTEKDAFYAGDNIQNDTVAGVRDMKANASISADQEYRELSSGIEKTEEGETKLDENGEGLNIYSPSQEGPRPDDVPVRVPASDLNNENVKIRKIFENKERLRCDGSRKWSWEQELEVVKNKEGSEKVVSKILKIIENLENTDNKTVIKKFGKSGHESFDKETPNSKVEATEIIDIAQNDDQTSLRCSLSLENLLSFHWVRAEVCSNRKKTICILLSDFLREVEVLSIKENELGDIVFEFSSIVSIKHKMKKYTHNDISDLEFFKAVSLVTIDGSEGYSLILTNNSELSEEVLKADFDGCSHVVPLAPEQHRPKEFRYRLVFPSLLYLARTLPRQDVFRKYRNAIPEPRMLKFNDERSNVNFYKGNICLTETNILSLVWRSEGMERKWSYYDCVTKFFRSPGIQDVVKDCNGELLATFSSRSSLEQLLRNFCTPATDSLAKVVAAVPRSKLVHFLKGLVALDSQTVLSRDICSGYNCSLSLDQHRVLFRDKLDMIKFLRDPNKRTNSMRICLNNLELVVVSSMSSARSVDSEVEGKEEHDPAAEVVEESTLEYRKEVNEKDERDGGEND